MSICNKTPQVCPQTITLPLLTCFTDTDQDGSIHVVYIKCDPSIWLLQQKSDQETFSQLSNFDQIFWWNS